MKGIEHRRKPSGREQLRVARAQLREAHRFAALRDLGSQPKAGPPQFIQCWAVAGRPVTQALDSTGQVWERHWTKATATTPESSWWEPLDMTRRVKKEEA